MVTKGTAPEMPSSGRPTVTISEIATDARRTEREIGETVETVKITEMETMDVTRGRISMNTDAKDSTAERSRSQIQRTMKTA